jgi:hypothetical protein
MNKTVRRSRTKVEFVPFNLDDRIKFIGQSLKDELVKDKFYYAEDINDSDYTVKITQENDKSAWWPAEAFTLVK